MAVVDGAKAIYDKLVADSVLPAEVSVHKGPLRPPSNRLGVNVEAVFVNDQGGLPPAPYLNSEGTRSTKYYDIWIRSSSVNVGRSRCDLIQDSLHLGDFPLTPEVESCFFNIPPVYSGRGRDDNHLWRFRFTLNVHEDRD